MVQIRCWYTVIIKLIRLEAIETLKFIKSVVLLMCWCTVIIKLIRLEVKETIKGNKVDGANKVLVHCNNKSYKIGDERNYKS